MPVLPTRRTDTLTDEQTLTDGLTASLAINNFIYFVASNCSYPRFRLWRPSVPAVRQCQHQCQRLAIVWPLVRHKADRQTDGHFDK